jgi:hypothetical protein
LSQLFKDFRVVTPWYGEDMHRLYQKAKQVDMGKVGHVSGFKETAVPKHYREQVMKIAIAYAMSQGIGGGQTETSLTVRNFLPKFDFGDEDDKLFKNNDWTFEYDRFASYPHRDMTNIEPPYLKYKIIAQTSKFTRNDQKVYILFGFKYLDTNKALNAQEIQVWRRGTKLLDRFPLPKFAEDRPRKLDIFETPCLFKKDDLMQIRVDLKEPPPLGEQIHDRIQFLGFVVESLGTMTMG